VFWALRDEQALKSAGIDSMDIAREAEVMKQELHGVA
jgi:hypothetical protein